MDTFWYQRYLPLLIEGLRRKIELLIRMELIYKVIIVSRALEISVANQAGL
jgi:hypothetical protein